MRIFLLAIPLFLFIVPLAFAGVDNLTPNQTGSDGTSTYVGCSQGSSHTCVNQAILSPDETNTMVVCTPNGGARYMYGLTDGSMPIGSTINWVRPVVRIMSNSTTSAANSMGADINVSDALYNGTRTAPSTNTWSNVNGTNFTTNPNGGTAWTKANIIALGGGFSTVDCNPDVDVTQYYVQVGYSENTLNITSNASFGTSGNVTFKLTGESFIFNGTCQSVGSNSSSVVMTVFDNSTGSLAASSTSSTSIVYVNVSSYSNTTVSTGENFSATFNVTTNSTALNLTMVIGCTSSDARGFNSSASIANIYRSYGFLNVTNTNPLENTSQNINQNGTFNLNATVACLSNVSNPVAYCGFVNATAVFNGTNAVTPDSAIRATGKGDGITNATGSNTTTNPVACGSTSVQGPSSSGLCSINWTLNASGGINSRWYVAVNFTSNGTSMLGNRTNSTQVNITGVSAVDVSFLLFVTSNNATGTQSYSATNATQQVIFNYTALSIIRANASVSNGTVQNESFSIFRYRNTGSTNINITMNFTTNLSSRPETSSVVIKAGWAENAWENSCTTTNNNLSYPNTTCVNLTVNFTGDTAPVRVANLSTTGAAGGKDRDIWLWADWNNMVAAFDQTATIQHVSGQG